VLKIYTQALWINTNLYIQIELESIAWIKLLKRMRLLNLDLTIKIQIISSLNHEKPSNSRNNKWTWKEDKNLSKIKMSIFQLSHQLSFLANKKKPDLQDPP